MQQPPDLERFVAAQDDDGTYERAVAELRAGRKRTHWMWFVLPQLDGLGSSPTARRFALRDIGEARAYLDHPVLGARLLTCARVLAGAPGTDPVAALGSIDAVKLRSSMTLFERAAPDTAAAEPFAAVLDHLYGGTRDESTLRLLDA